MESRNGWFSHMYNTLSWPCIFTRCFAMNPAISVLPVPAWPWMNKVLHLQNCFHKSTHWDSVKRNKVCSPINCEKADLVQFSVTTSASKRASNLDVVIVKLAVGLGDLVRLIDAKSVQVWWQITNWVNLSLRKFVRRVSSSTFATSSEESEVWSAALTLIRCTPFLSFITRTSYEPGSWVTFIWKISRKLQTTITPFSDLSQLFIISVIPLGSSPSGKSAQTVYFPFPNI